MITSEKTERKIGLKKWNPTESDYHYSFVKPFLLKGHSFEKASELGKKAYTKALAWKDYQ